MRDWATRALTTWKQRPLTSARMLGTGALILLVGLPFSLWYVIVGPTARDRLVAAGFLVATLVFGLYSLWEAKAPLPGGRSDPDDPPT
jgi:hypothetical protein